MNIFRPLYAGAAVFAALSKALNGSNRSRRKTPKSIRGAYATGPRNGRSAKRAGRQYHALRRRGR